MLYRFLQLLTRALLRVGFRLRAIGVENVPRAGAALLAANHASFLDPPAVGAVVPRQLHFLAKAELFRVPVLGGLIRRLNSHPVVREGADAAALRLGVSLLQNGHALLVFPEGTRGSGAELRQGRAGIGMLAALGGAPVVPVYIQGTAEVLPRGAVWPRRGRITVVYGAPFRFERGRGKAHYQSMSDEIMAAIGRLRGELEDGSDDLHRTAQPASPAGRIH